MAGKTVAAHIDEATSARLRDAAQVENRAPSQMLGVALKMFLDASPGARRALFAINGIADTNERRWAAGVMNRAALKAYEGIMRARNAAAADSGANTRLETEDDLEAEAVRACRK